MTVRERLSALRALMHEKGFDAYIIPTADAHQSEYTAEYFQTRQYFSGFTGSAGTLVVLAGQAALWTDGRYFLQAGQELAGSGIELMKEGVPGAVTVAAFLLSVLNDNGRVGLDGRVFSYKNFRQLKEALAARDITVTGDDDLLSACWANRPAFPAGTIFPHDDRFTGEESKAKLVRLRKAVQEAGADAYIVSSLDDIAWITNLRGSDVAFTPVFYAYFVLLSDKAVLFTNTAQLTAEARQRLAANGITTAGYGDIEQFCSEKIGSVFIDASRTSAKIASLLLKNNRLIEGAEISARMKMRKNRAELEGFKAAHIEDGVAMVRFMHWIETADRTHLTEYDAALKLREFREKSALFKDMSFASITGMAANGAIVHYHAGKEQAASLNSRGLMVVDSGAQYSSGTTDITRTVCFGTVSEAEKRDYTAVLKSHIMLASAIFPEGALGSQLDGIARYHLWQQGQNYKHGTGHGVGSFLAVHEGPVGVRPENAEPFCSGAVISIEPGIYKSGRYGIRLENLYYSLEQQDNGEGLFLGFKVLTLCPFTSRAIMPDMLTPDEISWLNDYHDLVLSELSGYLSGDELRWLEEACRPLEA
jgi:Xaa-Pro aminopeptidase